MKSKLKRAIAVLLVLMVALLTSCSVTLDAVKAAEISGGSDIDLSRFGEYISNDELGEIVSYGGYISKAEYAKHINSRSVGAYYHADFELCTDTGGSAIKYVSSVDGVHSPGTTMYQININGRRAYCIQPGSHTSVYVDYAANATGAWNNLSANQRQAVNTALCYGREGNFTAISAGTSIKSCQAYIATQVIIWEIIRGVRNSTAPYSLKSGQSGYIGLFCANGSNANIREAYNRIVKAMNNYQTVPSFASDSTQDVPTITLRATYNSAKRKWSYETVELNDSNSVLGSYFQGFNGKTVDVGNAKVNVSVSGNKITLTPSNGKLNGTQNAVTVSCQKTGVPQSNDAALVPYSASGYQDLVTGGSISSPTAYFKVQVIVRQLSKLNSDFKIRKVIGTQVEYDSTDEDFIDGALSTAENLEGWYFRVYTGSNSNINIYYHTTSFIVGPTDSNGFTESIGQYIMDHFDYSNAPNIVPSDFYYIEELGKMNADGTYSIPEWYEPLRQPQSFLFTATENTTFYYLTCHFTNIFTIPLEIRKTTDDDSDTNGYHFRITNRETQEQLIVKTTAAGTRVVGSANAGLEQQASDGRWYIVLPEGSYTLTELGLENGNGYAIPERFATPPPVDFEISPEAYKVAQQNGHQAIVIDVANRCEGYISLTKTESDHEDVTLEGAVYGVFSDEDCMELIYQMPPTDEDGTSESEVRFACDAEYYVKEIQAPVGYALSDEVYSVTIDPEETNEIVYDLAVDDAPLPNPVEIRKTDISGTGEIAGAHLEVRNAGGTVIDSWISTTTAHVIEDVAPGTYTLTETQPADGYVTAESITFTVLKDGEVTRVTMKDAPTVIRVNKVDENNQPLAGAVLQVLDNSGNIVIPSWTTDGTPYEIKGRLVAGQKYKLHEVSAPYGYRLSANVTFTVRDSPDVQEVKMTDRKQTGSLEVKKYDGDDQPLNGTTWAIENAVGETMSFLRISSGMYTYGSGGSSQSLTAENSKLQVVNLPLGDYFLVEKTAPSGKMIHGEKIPFTISPDSTTTLNIKLSVKDNNIIIPKTGSREKTNIYLAGSFSFIAALAVFTYYRKKKN